MFFGKGKINRCKKQSFPSSSEKSSSSNLERKKNSPTVDTFFFLYLENEPKDELCFAFKRLLFTLIKLSFGNNYLSLFKADVQFHDEDKITAVTKEYLQEPQYFRKQPFASFSPKSISCRRKSSSLTMNCKNNIYILN